VEGDGSLDKNDGQDCGDDDDDDDDDDVKIGRCGDESTEMKHTNENAIVEKEEWVNVDKQSTTDESKINDLPSLNVKENQNAAQENDTLPSAPPADDDITESTDAPTPAPKNGDESESAVTTGDTKKGNQKSAPPPLSDEEITALSQKLSKLKTQYNDVSTTATNGTVINTFLNSTSHQLTYHGLHELHKFVSEQSLCVFFRNNHFCTLTKQHGVLYLLVTDLGYANVPEVVWEKLDAIDGDTEYADEYFCKPKPRATLTPATGLNLNPEAVLAQRGRSEADYQLALQLSKGDGKKTQNQLDEEEGRLMAAATEASLMEYNKNNGGQEESSESNVNYGGTALQGMGQTPHHQQQQQSLSSTNKDDVDPDREMALALQAQLEADAESEQLAMQLQNEENQRQRQRTQQPQTGARRQQQQQRVVSPAKAKKNSSSSSDGEKSSCVIC